MSFWKDALSRSSKLSQMIQPEYAKITANKTVMVKNILAMRPPQISKTPFGFGTLG